MATIYWETNEVIDIARIKKIIVDRYEEFLLDGEFGESDEADEWYCQHICQLTGLGVLPLCKIILSYLSTDAPYSMQLWNIALNEINLADLLQKQKEKKQATTNILNLPNEKFKCKTCRSRIEYLKKYKSNSRPSNREIEIQDRPCYTCGARLVVYACIECKSASCDCGCLFGCTC